MKIFYSPSRGGFFSPDVHAALPDDAVAVTARRHASLIQGQEEGAQIVPGANGKPELQWPDRSATARRAAVVKRIRCEARRRIKAVSPPWRQMNDLRQQSEAGAARFAAIDAIRVASDAIEAELAAVPAAEIDTFEVRDNPLWPARGTI